MSKIQQAESFLNTGRPREASALCEEILREMPESIEALMLHAGIAAQRGEHMASIAGYDLVILTSPQLADAHANRGAALAAVNRFAEALASFERAIALDADHAAAHFSRAILWLLQGDFTRGWAEFEWRWKTAHGRALQQRRGHSTPLWLGVEDIAGKTILLYSEQGLGDTLQFCRFVKSVRRLGARVLLQVQAPLVPLLSELEGPSQVFADTEGPPSFDVHCPLLSLPLALDIQLKTIPTEKYLSAPFSNTLRWRAQLGCISEPRIGLAWRGDPRNPDDGKRSVALAQLLAHLPQGLRYCSLQQELTAPERQLLDAYDGHFEAWNDLNFVEAAALCECLDLVISVDTSIAHLSAALGRKTWILVPHNPDCRWMLERGDSPWYPSVTLHRQSSSGGWNGLLAKLAAELSRAFPLGSSP